MIGAGLGVPPLGGVSASAERATALGSPSGCVVVIGASAGGGAAIRAVLRGLPVSYPFPILVAQHHGPQGSAIQRELLSAVLALRVQEGGAGQVIRPGCVYIAPSGYHMLLESNRELSLSVDARVCYSRPSIEVLFDSASLACGGALVAVVLSGANGDGAAATVRVCGRGGSVLVQDPEEAEQARMPSSALQLLRRAGSTGYRVLGLRQMAAALLQLAETAPIREATGRGGHAG